ncbi:septation protein A [Candidatus Liberibacter americanus]|uniref:septation protein A n=1 Tax=Candidatus Liberibacter americanus TaxID=309868 RepID=UPI0002C6101D|nr:septation protein A [Candidatus Liberibacter americanus]EMS36325.1 intracellular septation protein A [Candidatus Liberibacter americanus PW_SP]
MTDSNRNKLVNFLLEFGPLIVFWIFNSYGKKIITYFPFLERFGDGIFLATVFFIISTGISMAFSWFWFGELKSISLISGLFVIILGGLTVWLRDDTFIKIKPTIIYSLLSAILFFGYALGKNFLRSFLSQVIRLDDIGWNKLNVRWAFFFLFLAICNELVWRNFSTETWIIFKLIGFFPMILLFGIAQASLINKHAVLSKDDRG